MSNIKLLFSSIIKGYSSFVIDNKIYYIKHLNTLDSCVIDIKKEEYSELAINKGYLSYKDRYQQLLDNKSWSNEQEFQLNDYKDFVQNLYNTKNKCSTKREKVLIDKEIENYKNKIFCLELEKGKLIGRTAESYASIRINEYYIFYSLYKDDNLKIKFFSEQEFKELESAEIELLTKKYNTEMSVFEESLFKKVALSPSWFNLFCLSGDNIYHLFNKPLVELTFYQIEIISWARQFKSILQNSKTQPPSSVMSDPEKILEWFQINSALDKQDQGHSDLNDDSKAAVGGKSYVGLTKEEAKLAGIEFENNQKLNQALKQKGEVGMLELIKMGV